jgi:hypothetical protein
MAKRGGAAIAALGLALAALATAAPARADDFTDQLDEARTAYSKHDLATAQTALNAAVTLMHQQRVEQWKAVLSEPLPGWKGEEAKSASAGVALFGGGISVSRIYRDDGGASITVTIVSDSPLIAAMGGVLNGLITTEDSKLLVIGGRKATYNKPDDSIMTMVADKAMVTVKGAGGARDDDLKAYFKAIRFEDIDKMAR